MIEKRTIDGSELWRFRLDRDNPRHEPKTQQQDIVDYLTANESVLPLLEDIAELKSLNPFDRFGAVRDGELLIALEGNRRLCALILLNDPELAPAKYRPRVRAAAKGWDPALIDIDVAVFDSRSEADPWLERRHQGGLGGKGQRAWSPAAKDRHFGVSANALALRLRDDALRLNLITESQHAARVVTTIRRFSDQTKFRKTFLGISTPKDDANFITDLTPSVLKDRLRVFFWGLFADPPTVTSRMSARAIEEWVDEVLSDPNLHESRSAAAPSAPGATQGQRDESSGRAPAAGATPGHSATKPSGGTDVPSSPVPVPRPQAPVSRRTLVDGGSFDVAIEDPVRRHVLWELSRIPSQTPLAASVVARVFLEGLYVDMWTRTCTGKVDSKLHVKVDAIVKVMRGWTDLTRAEKNALDVLQRTAQSVSHVLSPASLGSAAHGASVPAWAPLVAEWDSLLPITRRILAFVETRAGQRS